MVTPFHGQTQMSSRAMSATSRTGNKPTRKSFIACPRTVHQSTPALAWPMIAVGQAQGWCDDSV